MIHVENQDSAEPNLEGYLESWMYVDGLGRAFATLKEAEGGRWIVSGLTDHDAKSGVRRKYLEHFYQGPPDTFDFASARDVAYARQRYDAFGRQVQTFDLDGTVTLQSAYHALSTDLGEFMLNNEWLRTSSSGRMETFAHAPRCGNCGDITRGVTNISGDAPPKPPQ